MVYRIHLDDQGLASKIAGSYLVDVGFYSVIWFPQASMFFVLMRITAGRLYFFFKSLVGTAILTYVILLAQTAWTCEMDSSWKATATGQCNMRMQTGIFQLIGKLSNLRNYSRN